MNPRAICYEPCCTGLAAVGGFVKIALTFTSGRVKYRGSTEMVAKTRPALTLKEKKAVREFIAAVRSAFGDKIYSAALFGSKVHGDYTKYSDVDILLIADDDKWSFRKDIWMIASGIELEYDLLLDIRVISAKRWESMKNMRAGLYQNITRDAVLIRFHKKTAPVSA